MGARLFDIGLLRMAGFQLEHAPQQQAHGKRALPIAMTGCRHVYDDRRSADAGFDCRQVEPIDGAGAQAVIRRTFGRCDARACGALLAAPWLAKALPRTADALHDTAPDLKLCDAATLCVVHLTGSAYDGLPPIQMTPLQAFPAFSNCTGLTYPSME